MVVGRETGRSARLASANGSDSRPTSAPERAHVPGSPPASNKRKNSAESGRGGAGGSGTGGLRREVKKESGRRAKLVSRSQSSLLV